MLSTTLYSACTSIEIIIGRAMLIKSFLTGIVPILFSRGLSCCAASACSCAIFFSSMKGSLFRTF